MSYILDALKKSDQERQQSNGPSIQTVHKPRLLVRQSPSMLVLSILTIIVVAVVLIAGWLYFNVSQPVSTNGASTEKKVEPAITPIEPVMPVEPIAPTVPVPQPVAATAPISGTVLEFWELPDPIQKAIPAMTFSFHVFSDNPARRTIIINKRRVREGDEIDQGLLLEEITEQGVIFNWQQQHRFSINVVDNW